VKKKSKEHEHAAARDKAPELARFVERIVGSEDSVQQVRFLSRLTCDRRLACARPLCVLPIWLAWSWSVAVSFVGVSDSELGSFIHAAHLDLLQLEALQQVRKISCISESSPFLVQSGVIPTSLK
jgi:hypothetical protein